MSKCQEFSVDRICHFSFIIAQTYPFPVFRDNDLQVSTSPRFLDQHVGVLADLRTQVHQRQARTASLARDLARLSGRTVKVRPSVGVGLQFGAEGGLVDQQGAATSQFCRGCARDGVGGESDGRAIGKLAELYRIEFGWTRYKKILDHLRETPAIEKS